jgi:hypothetical protein
VGYTRGLGWNVRKQALSSYLPARRDGRITEKACVRGVTFTLAEWETSKAAWKARRAVAIASAALPSQPYRIRKLAEVSQWECQEAYVTARNHVAIGRMMAPVPLRGPLWSPAEYDADQNFDPELAWRRIGPMVRMQGRDPGLLDAEHHIWTRAPYAETGPTYHFAAAAFSTYPEAERWMLDYLSPAPDAVYFNVEDRRVMDPSH